MDCCSLPGYAVHCAQLLESAAQSFSLLMSPSNTNNSKKRKATPEFDSAEAWLKAASAADGGKPPPKSTPTKCRAVKAKPPPIAKAPAKKTTKAVKEQLKKKKKKKAYEEDVKPRASKRRRISDLENALKDVLYQLQQLQQQQQQQLQEHHLVCRASPPREAMQSNSNSNNNNSNKAPFVSSVPCDGTRRRSRERQRHPFLEDNDNEAEEEQAIYIGCKQGRDQEASERGLNQPGLPKWNKDELLQIVLD